MRVDRTELPTTAEGKFWQLVFPGGPSTPGARYIIRIMPDAMGYNCAVWSRQHADWHHVGFVDYTAQACPPQAYEPLLELAERVLAP